jgi:hypothetical protein
VTVTRQPQTSRALGAKMRRVNILAIVSMAIHDGDHIRQAVHMHYAIPPHIAIIFSAAYLPLLASSWWTYKGRLQQATLATSTVLAGVLLLLGFVHLVGLDTVSPTLASVFGMWGMSYPAMGVDTVSWAAFILLAIAYIWLLVITMRIRRAAHGRPQSQTPHRIIDPN